MNAPAVHPDMKLNDTPKLATRYLDVPNMAWEPTEFPGIQIKVLYSDDQGVTTKNLGVARRLTWRQINRIDVHADGLFMSPFRVPSRLDGFRGLFVRYADNQAQVAVAIDDHRRAHDGTAS